MAYHRQGAPTGLTTDASSVGIGAILEQEQEDGSYRPICYASRKLSKVEKRYSQFEREALAVRWACEKFHLYLYGIKFEIRADHKPLVTVLSPRSKPPSARIERWLLYLQQFQYDIRDNAADVLIRLPVGQTQKRRDERNRRFCLPRGSRSHASCISAKASRGCLSRRHNLAASAPSYYDR